MKHYDFKKLREVNLNLVATSLLSGTELGTKSTYTTRKYLLPSKEKIAVTGLKWINNTTGVGGYGAIDLLMHKGTLSLLEAAKALELLEGNNNFENDTNLTNKNIIIPEPCISTWQFVKSYLTVDRYIPSPILDKLFNDHLVWSDKNQNCVFPRDNNSGAYLRGTLPGSTFKLSLGTNGYPYKIPGDNCLIITEAPIDAISLRYFFPESTIIATGGRLGFDKIKPYLFNASKVLLAHDNDPAGDDQAARLAKSIGLKAERLKPQHNLKDWNEVLQYKSKFL
jgi:hypothetical protein